MADPVRSVSVGEGEPTPSPASAWPEFSAQSVFRARKRVIGDPDAGRIVVKGTDYSNPFVRKPMAAKGGIDKDQAAIARPMTFDDPLSGFAPQNPALDAKHKHPRQLERPIATGRIREQGMSAYRKGGK